jgi:hypothetical protein
MSLVPKVWRSTRPLKPGSRAPPGWLVKDRMEVTGARWGLDGAEAVLKLRAWPATATSTTTSPSNLKQEKQRNYDSRYSNPDALAA